MFRRHAPREIDAAELASVLGTERAPFVLDVREGPEVEAWAIPGVVNIPLGELPSRLDEVPADREVVAVCASGNRSSRATRFLASHGRDAANLRGGMAAWGAVYDTAVVEVPGARIVQVRRRGKGCLSYLVGAGGEAFAFDAPADASVLVDLAARLGWRISRVFDTHLHADHVSGARELARLAGASLHLDPADSFEFSFVPLDDAERFALPGGATVEVAALHTPGHTRGSTVFVVADRAVLTGDTLFVDGVGRPDLAEQAEEFARSLYHSLHDTVLRLPDDTLVLPGHYGERVGVRPDTVVGASLCDLRGELEPLSMGEEQFVTWASTHVAERPPNYADIVEMNMGRAALDAERARALEVGPNRCSV